MQSQRSHCRLVILLLWLNVKIWTSSSEVHADQVREGGEEEKDYLGCPAGEWLLFLKDTELPLISVHFW